MRLVHMTRTLRPSVLISALVLSALPCSGQVDKLRDFYESLSSSSATDKAPDSARVDALVSQYSHKLTIEELHTIVPVVRKCLASENGSVRVDAVTLLISLSTRLDSAQAMEPYEDLLIALLDQEGRKAAIYLLGSVYPRPSPKALAAFYSHLNDERNTRDEFTMIAGSLLGAFPADPVVVHEVLAAARRHAKDRVDGDIIQSIGLNKIINEDALAYVRAGFQNPLARIAVVQAIERMPKVVRDRFTSELRAVAQDPDEQPETRSTAEHILIEP
jgi:hypothetical protein